MTLTAHTSKRTINFNKHGWHLRWPFLWIFILGLVLVLLCLIIAGMEIGHTIVDVYRSTAFGGFILFIPLLICAIFVIVVAFKPRRILLRIAIILCCIMIILCILLIAYDILVLVDPTRCLFLSCSNAQVTYQVNSVVTGWPIYIGWPNYFQTNMNAKRIFMGIQLLCAILFIFVCALFLLTYVIYRHIDLNKEELYEADRHTDNIFEKSTATRHKPNSPPVNPENRIHRSVTTYVIEGRPQTSLQYYHSSTPVKVVTSPTTVAQSPEKTIGKIPLLQRQPTQSAIVERICIRCLKEPRMTLTTNSERQQFYSHLCSNCNNQLVADHRKPQLPTDSYATQTQKP